MGKMVPARRAVSGESSRDRPRGRGPCPATYVPVRRQSLPLPPTGGRAGRPAATRGGVGAGLRPPGRPTCASRVGGPACGPTCGGGRRGCSGGVPRDLELRPLLPPVCRERRRGPRDGRRWVVVGPAPDAAPRLAEPVRLFQQDPTGPGWGVREVFQGSPEAAGEIGRPPLPAVPKILRQAVLPLRRVIHEAQQGSVAPRTERVP